MNNIKQNSNAGAPSKCVRVYTKLKFVRSEISGAPVSFVSQNPKTGRICGVRQDSSYPKKICIVDKLLSPQIIVNALYDCTLIPMSDKNGYVVIAAEPVQFKAVISSAYIKNNIYVVEVKFGNKIIRFDPFNGKKESVKDIAACKSVLEKRIDIEDITQVVKDFERAAGNIVHLMERDKYRHYKI
jgi:hypothetical protein